jgi:hypothetical protein
MFKTIKKQYLLYLNLFIKPLKLGMSTIKTFLINEKKEFSKIIKTAWAEFYVEYDIAELKKISLYLILLLWILFQAYSHNSNTNFFISQEEYVELRRMIEEQETMGAFYEDVMQGQHNKIKKLEHLVNENKKVTFSVKMVFFGLGLATYAFIMMWSTWK